MSGRYTRNMIVNMWAGQYSHVGGAVLTCGWGSTHMYEMVVTDREYVAAQGPMTSLL